MLFQSFEFAIFFLLFCVGLSFFVGRSRRWYIILSSWFFYGWWYLPHLLILIALSAIAFFISQSNFKARWWPVVILAVLSPLIVFKYLEFILSNFSSMTGKEAGFNFDWGLPLGISFITFTVLSYIIDNRRSGVKCATDLPNVLLYVSFFPQLIAGPILRGRELIPQLSKIRLNWGNLKLALLLFSIGMLKKMAVADQLAPFVDSVFLQPHEFSSISILVAIYAFSIQIYCDFSGYTDMALGLALLLNVSLPLNFDRPYASRNIRQFWQRWHMTLSRWLRDYLYIPLGGSQSAFWKTALAIVTTMLVGGVWHGAGWNFILWGGAHGLLVAGAHLWSRLVPEGGGFIRKSLSIFITFHCVAFLWVFFRATSFENGIDIFSRLLSFQVSIIPINEVLFINIIMVILVLILHHWDTMSGVKALSRKLSDFVIYPVTTLIIVNGWLIGFQNPNAFIYFDF